MSSEYPTRRATDEAFLDDESFDPPSSLLTLPWIDGHNHAQTLSWQDRERYAIAGCRAMVTVASGYHWTPYKPVAAEDVRFLWDDVVNRKRAIERNHFFDVGLALGVHTGVRVTNPDELLERMDHYCRLDDVVALGETGVTPAQHVESWGVDEQLGVVEAQMALADTHELPIILHTPNPGTDTPQYREGVGIPGYEKNLDLSGEPVLTGDDPALDAVKLDMEAAADAGLSQDRIVASHADANNIDYLMDETDCYASFTVGYPWLTGVDAADVAATIREHGPDRVMVDTDCANVLRTEVFSVKRTVFELYRLGIDEDDIRQVVFENPRDVFGFDV